MTLIRSPRPRSPEKPLPKLSISPESDKNFLSQEVYGGYFYLSMGILYREYRHSKSIRGRRRSYRRVLAVGDRKRRINRDTMRHHVRMIAEGLDNDDDAGDRWRSRAEMQP